MIIIVTGTPATGKTFLANLISKIGYTRLDVARITKSISCGYDSLRGCDIVDTGKFVQVVLKRIAKKKNIVIDSHLAHYLPPDIVDLCIVTKCDLLALKKRLDKRYKDNPEKVRENLDAEIFDICYNEAKEFGHKVMVVDTTKRLTLPQIRNLISSK